MKMATTAISVIKIAIMLLLSLLLLLWLLAIVVAVGNRNFMTAVVDSSVESPKFAANVENFTINNKINGEAGNDVVADAVVAHADAVNENVNFIEFNQLTNNKSTEIGLKAVAATAAPMTAKIAAEFIAHSATDNTIKATDNSKAGYNEKFNTNQQQQQEGKILKRGKRYLDFVKGSRVSWRTTVKNNILKINTLWGHGWGFRSNFPFPDKKDRLRPFFKRDLLHATVDMLNGHGLDGQACILKSYCTALLDSNTNIGGGMIFKLLKFIFRSGFDGEACILKAFCTAHLIDEHNEREFGRHGLLFKLLKYIFTLNSHDKRHFPYLNLDNCHQLLHSHCPLSFNSISPYTDDV